MWAKENYIKYHTSIIKAQELFLNGKPDSSAYAYKNIFYNWKKPFARDCVTALQLACKLKDVQLVREFALYSFKAGYSYDAISLFGVINTFLQSQTDEFREAIKNDYKRGRAIYASSIDTKYRLNITILQKSDQLYKNFGFALLGSDRGSFFDSLYAENSNNIASDLIRQIKSEGFPGEHRIGLMDPKIDLIPDQSLYYSLSSAPIVLFLHNRCLYSALEKELLQAVEAGELHPRDYAWIYCWTYESFAADGELTTKTNVVKKSIDKLNSLCSKPASQTKQYNFGLNKLLFSNDGPTVDKFRSEVGIASQDHDARMSSYAKKTGIILYYSTDRFGR